MATIKVKSEFKKFEAGFNGKFAALEGRDDLNLFLIDAYRSGRKDYVDMFDNPPTLEVLLKAKTDADLQAPPANAAFSPHAMHLPANVQRALPGAATQGMDTAGEDPTSEGQGDTSVTASSTAAKTGTTGGSTAAGSGSTTSASGSASGSTGSASK